MTSKIWLSSPHMGNSELDYINQSFKDNYISTAGNNISKFEDDISNYIRANNPVAALSSGTAAIHLALILCGVTKGDEVLCQSFTFSATAFPIVYLGAIPIFVGSEEDTWNMSPSFLEAAILDRIEKGKKPKALIFVNTYGMPAKIDKILTIAKKYDLKIIEDAAESLGSTYKNNKTGTFGDFSIFSFNGNKIITTSGGGALVCRTEKDRKKAIYYALQAKEQKLHYEHSQIGFNYRLSNVLAGIGRGQMKVLEDRVNQRRNNHFFYSKIFCNSRYIKLFREPNFNFYSNHWLSCILISKEAGFDKFDIIKELEINHIEARQLWNPLHLQPVFKNYAYYGDNLSEDLFDSGVCLPSGSNMTEEDRERVLNSLRKFTN